MQHDTGSARAMRARRFGSRIGIGLALMLALPAAPATFTVTTTADGIPAPPGSLRAAIDASEGNGEPDFIVFTIDGGTIDLVAPLPTLLEGGLRIRDRRDSTAPPPGTNGIVVRGANGVARALEIRSPDNLVARLDFVDFGGPEIILVQGSAAVRNEIFGCLFGGDLAGGNAGAAIRLASSSGSPSFPDETWIVGSRFVGNGIGVAIESPNGTTVPPGARTRIERSWFGTGPFGEPGAGNGEAIRTSNGGRVEIEGGRFSGPGQGIRLGPGSAGSRIAGNEIGVLGSASESCSGFSGPAVDLDRSGAVEIRNNRIRCSDAGVRLGPGSDGSELHDNEIGGASPAGNVGNGVTLDLQGAALLRRNRIGGNEGFGVGEGPGPGIDPPDAVLACNEIARNGAGAIGLSFPVPAPPALEQASVVAVQGSSASTDPGWVEIFGDDFNEAGVFQGAVRLAGDLDPGFRHRLPVLDLRVNRGAAGSVISFERRVPVNHTGTLSDETRHRTSSLSLPLPAATAGLVYDVIRGRLSNLARTPDGIDLGPVVCLGSGLDPDPSVSPDVVDPEDPPEGVGFFYLSRRRSTLANVLGTYDPALCLTDVDAFGGPRVPSSGDCP